MSGYKFSPDEPTVTLTELIAKSRAEGCGPMSDIVTDEMVRKATLHARDELRKYGVVIFGPDESDFNGREREMWAGLAAATRAALSAVAQDIADAERERCISDVKGELLKDADRDVDAAYNSAINDAVRAIRARKG